VRDVRNGRILIGFYGNVNTPPRWTRRDQRTGNAAIALRERRPTRFLLDTADHKEYIRLHHPRYTISGGNMARRQFLTKLLGLPLLSLGVKAEERKKALKILMKSAWGSDDPTKAAFPFLHGLALAEAGHEVQIFLLGEATSLMRKATASAVVPVGWPPLGETMEKVAGKHITIFA
jgi:hypothetical protein